MLARSAVDSRTKKKNGQREKYTRSAARAKAQHKPPAVAAWKLGPLVAWGDKDVSLYEPENEKRNTKITGDGYI